MKSIQIITLIIIPLSLTASVDREFIFDIHDATSSTEEYINEALIVPIYQSPDNTLHLSGDFAGALPDLYNALPTLLQTNAFQATLTHTETFSSNDPAGNTFTIIACGLGQQVTQPLSLESFRRCFARALCQAEKLNIATVHIALPSCIDGTMKQIAQEIAAITYTSLYEYTALKTVKTPPAVKRICVHAHMQTPHDFKDVNIGLRIGSNLGNALCQARDWINTPDYLMTPTRFATTSAQYILPYIAKIETIIFEKEDITRMKMGGLLGASQGSDEPCTLVTHYLKSRRPNVPTIALIGSGLTHGVSEPSINISGAAAVLTALNVIAYRNIPANIVIITPLAQHTSNDTALKTGDILSMAQRNTIEITDTNAVGNLMIADAITHAITHFHPNYIIDIATLTDACKQTFGGCYAAVMSNNNFLAERIYQAAARSGELVWPMPLDHHYSARLQSDIADLRNMPLHDHTAQTQTAGCFIQQFVGNTPWAHIDISGAKTAQEYRGHGTPAFGIRLLIDLVESLAYGVK